MIQYKPKSVKTEYGRIKVTYDVCGKEKMFSLDPNRFMKEDLKTQLHDEHVINTPKWESNPPSLTVDAAKNLVFNMVERGDYEKMAEEAGYAPVAPEYTKDVLLCTKNGKLYWWKYQENPIQTPNHPNLAEVSEYGSNFIAMPARPYSVLRYSKRVPANRLIQLAIDCFSGLSALHAVGIIHLDISAHNTMVAPDKFVIIDFGLSFNIKNFGRIVSESPGMLTRMKDPDPIIHDHKSVSDMVAYYISDSIREEPTAELFEVCQKLLPVLRNMDLSIIDKIEELKLL
jgi:serine/threonine protein kinase